MFLFILLSLPMYIKSSYWLLDLALTTFSDIAAYEKQNF